MSTVLKESTSIKESVRQDPDIKNLLDIAESKQRAAGEPIVVEQFPAVPPGHCPAVCQGDMIIQYLSERPAGLVTVDPVVRDGFVRIGGTSHLIRHRASNRYLVPERDNPLVETFVDVTEGLDVVHVDQFKDHQPISFRPSGLYVVRGQRSGQVSDQQLATPFRAPRVD
jgi:hypothetical protein